MLKLKKAWVVVALSMLSLLVLSFGALAADEPSAQTAGTVTVGEGEDAAEYDLNAVRGDEDAGVLGAIDYTGSYADNLQSDENFEENVDKAIATVHTEMPSSPRRFIPPSSSVSLWAACFMQTLISRARLFMLSAPDLWRP